VEFVSFVGLLQIATSYSINVNYIL